MLEARINTKRLHFPLIFGSGLIAACVAFKNRYYFLQSTLEEAKDLHKTDPEFEIMYEKLRMEHNAKNTKKFRLG